MNSQDIQSRDEQKKLLSSILKIIRPISLFNERDDYSELFKDRKMLFLLKSQEINFGNILRNSENIDMEFLFESITSVDKFLWLFGFKGKKCSFYSVTKNILPRQPYQTLLYFLTDETLSEVNPPDDYHPTFGGFQGVLFQ